MIKISYNAKIIQIAVIGDILYALDDDGNIFYRKHYRSTRATWHKERLPRIEREVNNVND